MHSLTSINKIEQQFEIIAIVPAVVAPRPADDGCREGGGARVCRELLPPGAVEDEAGEVDHEERRLEVRREERLVVLKGKNMLGRKVLFRNLFPIRLWHEINSQINRKSNSCYAANESRLPSEGMICKHGYTCKNIL